MRKSNVTDEELGRVAWDAYSAAVGGKAFNGDPLPTWDVMVKDEKKQNLVVAWKKAGRAVCSLVERKLPADPKPAPALAIVGAPSGRVAPAVAAALATPNPNPLPKTKTLEKRTACCGSLSLSLKPPGRLNPGAHYVCACGDHVENV